MRARSILFYSKAEWFSVLEASKGYSKQIEGNFSGPKYNFGTEITKSHVRVLRPDEFEALLSAATELKEANSINLRVLLFTGMRYVEAQRFQKRPEWFDGSKFISLPEEAVLKHDRKQKERWIRLTPKGAEAVRLFFDNRALPSTQMWGADLKRWATKAKLNPKALCAKTTRKTWESWLCFSYPEQRDAIFASQGHTGTTAFHHYLNMPFYDSDKEAMKKWTEGLF